MRVAFMGTPEFAAEILEGLAAQHEVVCAYTMPDKVRGRGKKLVPSPVKLAAQRLGIEVRTPQSLSGEEEVAHLNAAELDVICVAAYGKLLPEPVLQAAKHGCVNVHASLLPRWRGAAPIERAILSGDEQVGVCIMQMEKGLDTGPYCVRRSIPVAGKGAAELTDELAFLGVSALLSALTQIDEGRAVWTEQDDDEAVYADKIAKGELDLDPDAAAEVNLRRVLASSEVHPSRLVVNGVDVTAVSACIPDPSAIPAAAGVGAAAPSAGTDAPDAADADVPSDAQPGEVRFTKKRFFLRASDGWLELRALKPAGRKEMPTASFLAGAHLGADSKWGRIGRE